MIEAGVQMDSLIARKLWRVFVVNDTETGEHYMVGSDDGEKVPLPPFSTNIDEAHRIVEFFQTKGWTFRVRNIPERDAFHACFYRDDGRQYRFLEAETMPMAICLAALAAHSGTNLA